MLSPAASAVDADRLFSPIDFSGGALVGVSGGSDSTALLLLLKHHLDRTFSPARLLAVTVDHRLRPGSAEEAEAVGAMCARHGISHRIVRWSGAKPATGLLAAARTARYRLLAEVARAQGMRLILTGHTADDQAETVLMRQARAAGPRDAERGLAGMAPVTLYDGDTWIVRPLLAARRAALRGWLTGQGAGWVDDPTNENETFERPRIRARLGAGTEFDDTIAIATRAAAVRIDLGNRAAALIRAHANRPSPGLLRLAPAFMAEPDGAAGLYALRMLMAVAGGAEFLPERGRSEMLLARLAARPAPYPLRATLSHAVIDRRAAGLFLLREQRGLPPAMPAGDGMIWDGRYRIARHAEGGELLIVAAGRAGATGAVPEPDGVPASLVRAALAAEPALREAKAGSTGAGGAAAMRAVAAPFLRFLSGYDLAPARAVAALIGGDAVADPPWAGHIDLQPWLKA